MSVTTALDKLNSTTRALKDVNVRKLTDALERDLGSKQALAKELPRLYKKAALTLVPIVRRILAANYKASGLEVESGELWRKSVTEATIHVNSRGTLIVVEMGSGGSKAVYAKAGAFRFGAVRNTEFKTTYTDLSTGETKTYKGGKGGLIGARAKRTIKALVFGTKAAKSNTKKREAAESKYALEQNRIIVIKPRPPFFTLDNGIEQIEQAFVAAVRREIASFRAGKVKVAA